MTPDKAKAALQFLLRVKLDASEAFVFVEVVKALDGIATRTEPLSDDDDDRPAGVSGGIA